MAIQFDHTANGLVTITTTNAASPSPYTLRLPDGPGSNTQVLTTDGTGNLSFSDAVTTYDNLTTKPSLNVIFTGDVTGAGNVNLTNTDTNILSIALASNNAFVYCCGNTITSCNLTEHLGINTNSFNFFAGQNAGNSITTGTNNVFLGNNAGFCNVTGTHNTFIGCCAGYFNTHGDNNNFLGRFAGLENTTGNDNNFFGAYAGRCNTTGSHNNFLGSLAGGCNSIGTNNTFIGRNAGRFNTEGENNFFAGFCAGYGNTTGSDNVFIGCLAGRCHSTGKYNTFIGKNTGSLLSTGCHNIFMGMSAGGFTGSGSYNLFFGFLSGLQNSGCRNIFLGRSAGLGIETGNDNIVLGNLTSSVGITTSTSNVIILATGGIQRFCHNASLGNTTIRGNIIADNSGIFFGDGAGITNINYCNVTTNRPAANILLTGDVTGSANAILTPGTTILSISATIAPNSVALGTDTTGNYVAGVTAGTGILVTGSAGEGWSPTVSANTTYLDGRYLQLSSASLQTVTGPVSFNGNVFFEGAVTYVGAQNLTVEDSLIALADNNTADTVDIGIIGRYDTTKYTGLFRDATNGEWRLFKDYTGFSNTETTIDIADSSFQYANLTAEKLTANSTVESTSTSTGSIISLGGVGIAGNLFVGNLIVSGVSHTFGANLDTRSAIIGGNNSLMSGKASGIITSSCSFILADETYGESCYSLIGGSEKGCIRGAQYSSIISSCTILISNGAKYSTIIGSTGVLASIGGNTHQGGIYSSELLLGGITGNVRNSAILASYGTATIQSNACQSVVIASYGGELLRSNNTGIIASTGSCIQDSGNSVIIGGITNTLIGQCSVILGGGSNQAGDAGCSDTSQLVGASCLGCATGQNSVILGSKSSTVTSACSSIISSEDSTILSGEALNSIIASSCSNIISDSNTSAIIGGNGSNVSAYSSVILGGCRGLSDVDGKVIIPGQRYGLTPFTDVGGTQIGKQVLLGNTSSTLTSVDLFSTQSTSSASTNFRNAIGIRNSHVYTIKGTITAANATGTVKVWDYTTVAKANATGVISFIGSYGTANAIINTIAADSGTSAWEVIFRGASNLTQQQGWVTAYVTGSADSIKWMLTSETSELKYS
jgi:hypothetical protein